jgi:hypothetical protein
MGIEERAGPASSSLSSFPTIIGEPSGDGLEVQFRLANEGYVWIMVTTMGSPLTLDTIKNGIGAVGEDSCRVGAQTVDFTLQSVTLSGCSFMSGPQYQLHLYTEGLASLGDDGSFAGSLTFQVVPSNAFDTYPVITTPVTGVGFTFVLAARKAGYYWSVLVDTTKGQAVSSGPEAKAALGAQGGLACRTPPAGLPLLGNGTTQELTLVDCELVQNKLYHLYVYLEDTNGNDDGILSQPVDVVVAITNRFLDSPVALLATMNPQGFQVSFVAQEEGFAWGALFHEESDAANHTVPSFLQEYYPNNSIACAPVASPILKTAENSTSTLAFTGCTLNFSQTYWALVYIEGPSLSKSGAISYTVPVEMPPSNRFVQDPVAHAIMTTSFVALLGSTREGQLWSMVVHEDHAADVTVEGIKAGTNSAGQPCTASSAASPPCGACRMVGAPINESLTEYQHSGCRLVAGQTYYAFFYVQAEGGAGDDDGLLSVPVRLYVTPSNWFTSLPRLQNTPTTNYNSPTYFTPAVSGKMWIFIIDNEYADEIDMDYFLARYYPSSPLSSASSPSCEMNGVDIFGGVELTFELLFCQMKRAQLYFLYVYIEDHNGEADGTLVVYDVLVPKEENGPLGNEFYTRPYITGAPTLNGLEITFEVRDNGVGWAAITTLANVQASTLNATDHANGNYAELKSLGIADIMAQNGIMQTTPGACWFNAAPVYKDQDMVWTLSDCELFQGTEYLAYVYVAYDVNDTDGRMSQGMRVVPPYSVSFVDGPSIVGQPHGDGLTLNLMASSSQYKLSVIVVLTGSVNTTIASIKAGDGAIGDEDFCRLLSSNTKTQNIVLDLTGCSLLTGTSYTVFAYVEDKFMYDDGQLAVGITFSIPITNSFLDQPSIAPGEPPGLDAGLKLVFEATAPGKAWVLVVRGQRIVTMASVKAAEDSVDQACAVSGRTIGIAVEAIDLPNCPLKYLETYFVYVYVEDSFGHLDGTLSDGLNVTIGPSNGFTSEPVLSGNPTSGKVSFRFTAQKPGKAWILLRPLSSLEGMPQRIHMKSGIGAIGEATCKMYDITISAQEEFFTLDGCGMSPDQIYALFVYVEDFRGRTDGTVSRPVSVKVPKSNTFALNPIIMGEPTLDGLVVNFTAEAEMGQAWALSVEALAKAVTPLGIRDLDGAVGGSLCKYQSVFVDGATQIWTFADCQFEDGEVYLVHVYVEGSVAVPGDGTLSGPLFISFKKPENGTGQAFSVGAWDPFGLAGNASNTFTGPLALDSTPMLTELDVRFAVAGAGYSWGVVVPTDAVPLVDIATMKAGVPVPDFMPCKAGPLYMSPNDTVNVLAFRDCALVSSTRYMAFPVPTYKAFIYVEDEHEASDGALSSPLPVPVIGAVSNWFRDDPKQLGVATPSGVTLRLRAGAPSGRMWVMVTRFAMGIQKETVQAGRNAVGGVNCRAKDQLIDDTETDVLLSDCDLQPTMYYYAHIYVAGRSGALDGTLSPPVEVYAPTRSNGFSNEPRLYSSATEEVVKLSFTAEQQYGRLWLIIIDASYAYAMTVGEVKSAVGALGDPIRCQRINADIDQGPQLIHLKDCALTQNVLYMAMVYVEDSNGLNDGTLALLSVRVRARPPASNGFAFEPVLSASTDGNLVQLRFQAQAPGTYWAFIVPSSGVEDVLGNLLQEEGRPMFNAILGCWLSGIQMTTEPVLAQLTGCGLDLSSGVEYDAMVIIKGSHLDEDGNSPLGDGQLSSPVRLLPASNFFAAPFPALLKNVEVGSVAISVTPSQDGKVWIAIFGSQYVPSLDSITVDHMKNLEDYLSMGAYGVGCNISGVSVVAGETVFHNLEHCAFNTTTEYKAVVYLEDDNGLGTAPRQG